MLDLLCWQIESCPDGQFEVRKACIFSIALWLLVIGFLVFSNSVSKAIDLLTKMFFHFTVSHFMGSDSFKESIADVVQGNGINVIPDGIEGCGNCAG
jgi:hypothetical protein